MRRAAAAVLLLAALGLAWWGYSGYKKRELQGAVGALVTDATARVRDALQAGTASAGELERLEGHYKALGESARRLAALDGWRDPPLSEAAQRYLDEAHALLRRQLALATASGKLRAGLDALAAHIGSARGRSSGWIHEAVALRQQMDRDFFDYRLAEGGLLKSLQAMPNARQQLAPLVAPAPLIEDGPLADAQARLAELSAQLARRVEAARQLPVPR